MAARTHETKENSSAPPGALAPLVKFERAVPPVRRTPIALARRFFQICTTALAESVKEAGLTPLEYAVLAYVTRDEGEPDIDQSSLAQRLGVDRNNTSLLVERLVSKGLLDRRINGDDRRARLLRCTSRGEKLCDRLAPQAIAGQQRILWSLKPAERELLLDLLVRVIESNQALARPGAGRRKRGSVRALSNKT